MASIGNAFKYNAAVSFECTGGVNQTVYTVAANSHARLNIGYSGAVSSLKVGGREWIGQSQSGVMHTDVYMAAGQTIVISGGFMVVTGVEFLNT